MATVDPKVTIDDLMDDLDRKDADFFRVNSPKLDELLKATRKDMEKAEHAMLRKMNDQYRKIIFDSQVYANTGAGTLKQVVDMASRDFLRAGINCIKYKDGRLVNIASYAEMAIRTANQRAVLISEGNVRQQHGWHLVRISRYGGCSETCLPWQGRVYVDDVYSGGTKAEAKETGYPLLSEAIAGGLFHPNCKHRATTFFQGMQNDHSAYGKLENEPKQAEHNKCQREIQRQKRIAAGSLDEQNVQVAKNRQKQWEKKDEKLLMHNKNLQHKGFEIQDFSGSNKKRTNKNKNHIKLENYAKDSLKIEKVPSLEGLDYELIKNIFNSIAGIYNDIPETYGKIKEITLFDGGLLGIAPIGGKYDKFALAINSSFYSDPDRLKKNVQNYIRKGVYAAGTTGSTIIYHELGHMLDGIYITKNYPVKDRERVWDNGISATRILKEASMSCYGDNVAYKDALKSISGYAASRDDEGLAECCHMEFTDRGNEFTNTVVSILLGKKR